MSVVLRPYENLLRPAYEGIAAIGWTIAALVMLCIALFTNLPRSAFFYMGAISLGFAAWRWKQTIGLWDYKLNLAGKPFAYMRFSMLRRLMACSPADLWLGFGFDWKPQHTQRAVEIRKRDASTLLPPKWFVRFRNAEQAIRQTIGLPWIHGIEPREQQIYVPLSSMEGHTLVVGTTGSGKTRLFETLISQAILRGEAVVIIDPKGDKELAQIAEAACKLANRPDAFVQFHPAAPSKSIRIDPLANWNNITEIASRIAALMPSESGSDSFTQIAWKAVHVVVEALVYVDQMPNLSKLRRNIEGGPERLMEEVLKVFFARNIDRWETLTAALIPRAREGKLPLKVAAPPELLAFMYFYKSEVPESKRHTAVDGLMALVEHNREHLGKILASLVPLLVMLTAGELGKMLSPDPNDIDDERPILNTSKLINGGYVLYLGLDSLSNATVGSAIGSMLLADYAAVAGATYNYVEESDMKRVQMFVDEAAEVVNVPLIQLLNKSRGAKFTLTLATQTYPDFVARMGSEAKARQILGNLNNLIALRTIDRLTQEFVAEKFGETEIQAVSKSVGSGNRTEDHGIDFTGNISYSMQEKTVSIFPPELLGMLQNLHYVALMSGGRIIKGRLPKLLNS